MRPLLPRPALARRLRRAGAGRPRAAAGGRRQRADAGRPAHRRAVRRGRLARRRPGRRDRRRAGRRLRPPPGRRSTGGPPAARTTRRPRAAARSRSSTSTAASRSRPSPARSSPSSPRSPSSTPGAAGRPGSSARWRSARRAADRRDVGHLLRRPLARPRPGARAGSAWSPWRPTNGGCGTAVDYRLLADGGAEVEAVPRLRRLRRRPAAPRRGPRPTPAEEARRRGLIRCLVH